MVTQAPTREEALKHLADARSEHVENDAGVFHVLQAIMVAPFDMRKKGQFDVVTAGVG